ncbi:MAG: FAD-binding oxidoreductase [Woeseiaceae bacterium]|nr:FAD-binding oxidoreductase [Woeseiaceae bacterium]
MLIDDLKHIVGPDGWTTDPQTLEPHLKEWRELVRGRTAIMVSPATTAEVAAVVRACHESGTGIVPQGGNTGLCGGAIPDASGSQVLLSLARLDRVRRVDPDDFSIVVEAGCILADVQRAARDAGRLFPLSLAAEGSCQIGGNLSTDAGGINVLRYGTARQQALGLEVVLADGTVLDGLRTLRKDTAGYDLKQLFLGSEGTLGIITAAALRLYPLPRDVVTVFAALESVAAAVTLLGRVRRDFSDRVQAFELISARALRFVARHVPGAAPPLAVDAPWFVLLDLDTGGDETAVEALLGDAVENGQLLDAAVAKSGREAERFWRLRHAVSEAQKPEGASLKHDVSVPIGSMEAFLEQAGARLANIMPDARPVIFGHVGDGNLHYNITRPSGFTDGEFRDRGTGLTDALYDLVAEFGGSISAEHGIGTLKRDALARYRHPVELDLMRRLKKSLDPRNILNPGKVI